MCALEKSHVANHSVLVEPFVSSSEGEQVFVIWPDGPFDMTCFRATMIFLSSPSLVSHFEVIYEWSSCSVLQPLRGCLWFSWGQTTTYVCCTSTKFTWLPAVCDLILTYWVSSVHHIHGCLFSAPWSSCEASLCRGRISGVLSIDGVWCSCAQRIRHGATIGCAHLVWCCWNTYHVHAPKRCSDCWILRFTLYTCVFSELHCPAARHLHAGDVIQGVLSIDGVWWWCTECIRPSATIGCAHLIWWRCSPYHVQYPKDVAIVEF